MQWLTLACWILVVLIALPAAIVPLPSVAGQALSALAGFCAIVVFVAVDLHGFAWGAFGLAIAGTLLAAVGAHTLVEDEAATLQDPGRGHKYLASGLLGLELPFFAVAAILSISVAIR